MEERKEMIERLKMLLFHFENKNWLKMKTTSDLAAYIVDRGFCPSVRAIAYQNGIREILELVNKYQDDEYNIIDKQGIKAIRAKIYELIGEK